MYKRPVTLKDVAEESDYSLRTVKKVMSGDLTVRPETRENVLQTARKLGYKKNMVASVLATNKLWNIAIVMGDYRYFFPEAKTGFQNCHKSWSGLKVEIEFLIPKDKSIGVAKSILQNILQSEKYDAVIMHAISMEGLNREINAIVESGRPVCTFGADAPRSKRLFYVGPKAYESGRIAAQVMSNYIGGQGTVYMINQVVDEMQTLERGKGFTSYMKEKHPEIRIENILVKNGSGEYHEIVAKLMQSNTIRGIVGTDADCYIIGLEAYKAKRKDIVTLGFDLTPEIEQMMLADYFKIILSQNPEQQASIVLDSFCKYLLYHSDIKNIYTDVTIVTSEVLRYKGNVRE